jgi:hypothetical protein
VFRTLSLLAAVSVLAFSLAADPAEARKRGGDISGSEGKNQSGSRGESKDSKTIQSYSKEKPKKEKEVASEPEAAPEPTESTETTPTGGITYDLDVEDATVGSESTTPTADYDLEVAPGPDWDYWAREAGVIQ